MHCFRSIVFGYLGSLAVPREFENGFSVDAKKEVGILIGSMHMLYTYTMVYVGMFDVVLQVFL